MEENKPNPAAVERVNVSIQSVSTNFLHWKQGVVLGSKLFNESFIFLDTEGVSI